MGNRVWSVVVVDSTGKVQLEHHVTDVYDSNAAYIALEKKVRSGTTIVAMIPGNHISGAKTYNLSRTKNTNAWVDPFDMPTDMN
tara:strand:+ start:242 stop:493 length:252 start_codon:yes stop_codon:yes gene_type:complete